MSNLHGYGSAVREDDGQSDRGDEQLGEQPQPGWFGPWGNVRHAIRTVGGDLDDDGQPVVDGVALFLGIVDDGNDAVVSGDAKFYSMGRPQSLPLLMNSTSYGLRNVEVY